MKSIRVDYKMFAIGLAVGLIAGCEVATQGAGPRVERVLVGGGEERKSAEPLVKKRDPWEELSRVKVFSYCETAKPLKFQMSNVAIRKAVMKSSVFLPEDHDRVVQAIDDWIRSERHYICGTYQEFMGQFRISFEQQPGKEPTLVIWRGFVPGWGPFAFMSVLEGRYGSELYRFNLEGDLLDVR